ncbi:MAG: TRAM domain-containing protein, partial [Chitinivibrionales bacterium]|nr:TRAM domain-containing protein [Chitinivibrionales bacterium]MBD3356431.1 TRAM domain-containing protein [Chitinivibrionales bacterium]
MRDVFMRLTGEGNNSVPTAKTARRLTITIERIVHGGFGLARTEQGVVLVTDTLPGEKVEVGVVGRRSGTPVCTPYEIIKPSASRRAPFCPYASVCGGCNQQHILYDEQVRIKKEI